MREHYQKANIVPDELKFAQSMPEVGRHVWEWFGKLHKRRGSSGFGPNPLSCTEIEKWACLSKLILRPWEVEIIYKIDEAYLEACSPND